jgi:hypothetical protein
VVDHGHVPILIILMAVHAVAGIVFCWRIRLVAGLTFIHAVVVVFVDIPPRGLGVTEDAVPGIMFIVLL